MSVICFIKSDDESVVVFTTLNAFDDNGVTLARNQGIILGKRAAVLLDVEEFDRLIKCVSFFNNSAALDVI